jgi:hypothetical protein
MLITNPRKDTNLTNSATTPRPPRMPDTVDSGHGGRARLDAGRAEANERLARNHGVIASFSRALTEGLRLDQSGEEFDAALEASIAKASAT